MQNAKFRIYYYLCRLKKNYIPMEMKLRLQRVLQIVEEAERTGTMSDLERDIVLAELREAYSEVKFGVECTETKAEPEVVAPVMTQSESEPQPQTEVEEQEEQDNEPEVEFEIIYNEEDDDEESDEVDGESPIAEPEPTVVPEPAVAPQPIAEPEPIVVPEPAVAPQPIVEPAPVAEPIPTVAAKVEERIVETNAFESELSAFSTTPRRSAILSLYEDSVPVVGEQFREAPSVADVISCPKGVAESTPLTSLREAIGVADKFMLVSELFGGDNDAYEATINALDVQPSFDDCVIYIAENCSWRAQSDGTKFMMELLQRKYNA